MSSENKKSFVLYLDSLDILDELSANQKADLFDAIRDFHRGINPNLDGLMKAVFIPFKNQFQRDQEKYKEKCKKNKVNAEKRWQKKGPTASNGMRLHLKNADNDNDNETDNENDIDNEIGREKNARAIEILRKHKQSELETLDSQNRNYIDDKKKLVESFNDKMEIELDQGKIEFTPEQLMPRFRTYVRQWISNSNQSKNIKTPEPESYESGKLPRK